MSNAMDKISNSALDAGEEHVVQRLEDTGLVVLATAAEIIVVFNTT